MGPPTFPDAPVPTWEAFCDDYRMHFFDGSAPLLGRSFVILVDGEPVGQVNYNDIEERGGLRRTELDIWLRAERFCGHGYGSDALETLCTHLAREFGVRQFVVQPSARNPRAIRAYEKIGFVRQDLTPEQALAEWGPRDYHDSVVMVKTLDQEEGAVSEETIKTRQVAQIGIVVPDIEAAARAWAQVFGLPVPPIIVTDPLEKAQTEYRGEPTAAQAKLAFFRFENIDIELIEPISAPSTWREQLEQHGPSLHHIAFRIQGMAATRGALEEHGIRLVQRGEYTGGRYAYLDALGPLGVVLELLEND